MYESVAILVGFVSGFVSGVLVETIVWWVLHHRIVPKIEFSPSISKLPTPLTREDRSGYRYRVRLQNSGRRNVIDIEIAARLRVSGLTKHEDIWAVVDIPQKADGSVEWRISRMLPVRKGKPGRRPIMFLHINSAVELREWRMIPKHIRGEVKRKTILLEDLLSLGDQTTIRYRAFGYDEVSGSRKVFFSKPYTIHDIKEGPFEKYGLEVIGIRPQEQREASEENGMIYYIYENWTVRPQKARVHVAECSWCDKGRGVHKTGSQRNGRWCGPFRDLSEAIQAAEDTGYQVSLCKKCNPT